MTAIRPDDARALAAGTHGDPFAVLGPHEGMVRALMPGADAVTALDPATGDVLCDLTPIAWGDGIFAGAVPDGTPYRLGYKMGANAWVADDPYRYGPVLGDLDEHLIGEGAHLRLWDVLGAHVMVHEGAPGTHFAVWAPNARRVSVVGDFNGWDGRRNPMRRRGATGVWELFIPGIGEGEAYKYELLDAHGTLLPQKADPFGFGSEHPPRTASVVRVLEGHDWADAGWMTTRAARHHIDAPISVYEVHLGSWKRGHFPEDAHGLGKFDGTPLYEHSDRREGFHPDWNTLVFNYGRREVSNYLVANAVYWLREHHIDGLRVDAVASMLYRDYSRKDGEWVPNVYGERENLEAIDFLRRTNEAVYADCPGIMTVAEESTAFPGVSTPTDVGGLGFGFKWNMGWMNDTLSYMAEDPINRKYHHGKVTFGLHYAFSENFILPISHDEVVHGKGSILDKMPGWGDEKFANLRAYYGLMWGHPGKKLLFMGCEIAQGAEWDHDSSVDWHLLDHPQHKGVQTLVRDLNALYTSTPALYQQDCSGAGFEWVEELAQEESLFAWVRHAADGSPPVLVVSNMTPVERHERRVGVPVPGRWAERLNTDADAYGGGGRGNLGGVTSEEIAASGRGHSICITIPPLSTIFFQLERDERGVS